jgi:hypothetical protein
MKSVRRLLVAFYGALLVWVAALVIADARNRKCDANDLTECDALGDVLLGMTLLMPALLLLLLWAVCVATVTLLKGMSAKAWVQQPVVLAVLGTVGLLAVVLGLAIFSNLEGLVS